MSHWWLLAHMLILHLSWLISACSNNEVPVHQRCVVQYWSGNASHLLSVYCCRFLYCWNSLQYFPIWMQCLEYVLPLMLLFFLKHLLIWEQWLYGFLLNTCTVVLIFCVWKVFQWCQNCCIYHYNEFCETLSALCISTWSTFLNVNFFSMKWFCCM